MPIEAVGPNAEQIKYWNEVSGPKWVSLDRFIDPQIEPLGRMAMDKARLVAGQRVLDVGCGCGNTSFDLARRVGPTGAVTGVDISGVMLALAAETARERGLPQVSFENADAQSHKFSADYDLVFSRFGVMFFADPVAAFRNLRGALRPGGKLVFVCWQPVMLNPWMLVPTMAAMQHVAMPPPPTADAPGPFAFADPERVRSILTAAGFASISFDDVQETLTVGGGHDLDRVVEFLMQMGPAGTALRDADANLLATVAAAIKESLQSYSTDAGVRMGSAAWIVSATPA